MSPIAEKWKDIGVDIPSLLPLQAAPQEESQIVPYLQSLHNYLAGDRQVVVRTINVLSRFRLFQADDAADTIKASGSGTTIINTETGGIVTDPVTVPGDDTPPAYITVAGSLNTDNFDGLLSVNEDTVQVAMDLIDDLTIADFPDEPSYLLADGTRELTGEWGLGGTYGISEINYLDFDLTPTEATQAGRLQWDATDHTLQLGMVGGVVNLQMGQEMLFYCVNDSGVEIANGKIVYQIGTSNGHPTVGLADATAASGKTRVFGVATETIANGTSGYINTGGMVRDVDTSGLAAGNALFLSTTGDGSWTLVPPAPPDSWTAVGLVVDVGASGSIYTRIFGIPIADNVYIEDAGNYYLPNTVENALEELGERLELLNGTFEEAFDATASEAGGVVTVSLEQSGGGDLTYVFSTGRGILDCTDPVQTIALTLGTDSSPQANYIYLLESSGLVTKSTTQWPATEHVKIGFFLCPSAAQVASDGLYINQNWNDHVKGTDEMGHLAHIAEHIRLTTGGAAWHSGIAGAGAGSAWADITINGGALDDVYFKSTAGVAYQLHRHTVPAQDMSGADDCHVVNWDGDAYHEITNINEIVDDSTGATLSNRYYNLTFWTVANKTGEYAPLMCNVPDGSYNSLAAAVADTGGYDVNTIPTEFSHESSTGLLICRLTFKHAPAASGTITLVNTVDLRGTFGGVAASGGGSGSVLTEFSDNLFTIYDSDDVTKILNFDLAAITTGNTRTITPADAAMTLLSTTDHTDLTDGGDTTLHDHADAAGRDTTALHLTAAVEIGGLGVSAFSGLNLMIYEVQTTGVKGKLTLTALNAGLDHDALTNFAANEHIDWTANPTNNIILANNFGLYVKDTPGGVSRLCLKVDGNNDCLVGGSGLNELRLRAGTHIVHKVGTAAPADAVLDNNTLTFWYDSTGPSIEVKHKDGGGTVRSGTVASIA